MDEHIPPFVVPPSGGSGPNRLKAVLRTKKLESTPPSRGTNPRRPGWSRRAKDMATGPLAPVLKYLDRVTASGPTDGHLLERYRRGGDRAAFAALVERHGPMVFGV